MPPEGDGTVVWQSDESPTGYYVTFRYADPEATRVRIYGEWWFTDLAHASVRTSLNATPDQWQDGYTIWKGSKQWPTVDMTQDEETGLWTYTIPLPTGHWGYRFYVGGVEGAELTDYTDAVITWDPSNPPMIYDPEAEELKNDEYLSHVYVPWDPEKQGLTPARAEEAPREGENGEAFFDQVTTEDDFVASFGVYLPYEFDAEREEPYPVLVLFHGGGGSESEWFTNGLINILDNMIAEGRLEPTVVVTPNGEDHVNSETGEWDRPLILKNVVDYILPYMVENYNVAEEPERRAFAGLSMGGATVMYAFFHNTDDFQYFLAMSPPMLEVVDPDYTIENLGEKTLWFGYGMYDFVKLRSLYSLFPGEDGELVLLSQARRPEGSLYEYLIKLAEAGVPFTNIELPYGHDWVLWRMAIVDAFDNVLWQ
jgi:enterochelin esterase-like enzyme